MALLKVKHLISRYRVGQDVAYLLSLFPADPEVSAREEAGDGVARQVVDPALPPQLSHDGINERVPGAALLQKNNNLSK